MPYSIQTQPQSLANRRISSCMSPWRAIRLRPWAAVSAVLFLLVSAAFLLVVVTDDNGWAVVAIVLAFLGLAAFFASLLRREGLRT